MPVTDDKTWRMRLARLLVLAVVAAVSAGCTPKWPWLRDPTTPSIGSATPSDLVIRRAGQLEADAASKSSPELAAAHDLYRKEDYSSAKSAFHKIADNKQNSALVAEEARYYEAESLRQLGKYPKAVDTYHKLLIDFPAGSYREQAVRRMYEIANYWLDDTRKEMTAYEEKLAGKRTFVITPIVHFDKTKPLLDEEGRALQALEQVFLGDMRGPMADKALFMAGQVKFYRGDYQEADHFFSLLVENHPNSPLAPQAVERAILAKHLGTGGPDYDARKSAEAYEMIDAARKNYPALAQDPEKSQFLDRQMIAIKMQQAEKDWRIAEFYRRTGHMGSAYFYYEIVRRRYPGTKYHDDATRRMEELRAKLEYEQAHPPRPSVSDWLDRPEKAWRETWDQLFSPRPDRGGEGETKPEESPAETPRELPPPRQLPASLPTELAPRP